MAQLNSQTLKTISKAFKDEFNRVFKEYPTNYDKVATVVKAKAISVDYAWLGDIPNMREWIGDRELKDLKAYKYTITKKRFEATIEIDRDHIIYDTLGVVKPRIQSMAAAAKTHYDELVFGLLEKNDICYDGKKFFGEHKLGKKTYTNLFNLDLTQENFLKVRAFLMSIRSESNRNLKIKPNLLVIPPQLEEKALKILKSDQIDGTTNITKNMADILVSSELTDEKSWYLTDTTKPIKPLILQISKPITFTAMDKPDDEAVFMRAAFRYGVDAEHNAGYGLWQLIAKSTPDSK